MNHIHTDEVSIEELYIRFKAYLSDLWSFKYWILSITLIYSSFFSLKSYFNSDNYVAKVVFTVNESNQNSGMGAIFGEFGLGGSVSSNYLKIKEIAFSNQLLFKLLRDTIAVNNRKDLIINHIIRELKMHDSWEEDTLLCDYSYEEGHSTSLKNYALKQLSHILKGDISKFQNDRILYFSFNEESTLIEISAHTNNQELSALLVESWYNKIFNFYTNNLIKKDKYIFDCLNQKADSIYSLITNSENVYATEIDKIGIIKNIDKLEINHQVGNLELYGEMYAEIIKNKETAEFIMNTKMPYFRIIDKPILPLDIESNRLLYEILKYILEGLILAIVFSSILSVFKSKGLF